MIVKYLSFWYNKCMEKTLKVVQQNSQEMQVIKKSKFITLLFDANKQNYQEFLKQIKRDHLSSTHICYAYRFCNNNLQDLLQGELDITQGYFDDGEPSGTAGAPILKAIVDNNLVNVLVVVVRYFGGIKLGASGLIKAYKSSAELVMNNLQELCLSRCYKINTTYSQFNILNNFFVNNDIKVYDKSFDDNVCIKIAITNPVHLQHILSVVKEQDIEFLGERYV